MLDALHCMYFCSESTLSISCCLAVSSVHTKFSARRRSVGYARERNEKYSGYYTPHSPFWNNGQLNSSWSSTNSLYLFVVQETPFCYEMFITVTIKAHNFNLFYNLNFMLRLTTL